MCRVFLREREGVFDGALNLREDRGRQSSKFFNDTLFIRLFYCSVTAFEAKVRPAVPFAITTYDRGRCGAVFFVKGAHNDELAEAIDTIVGHHNGGTSLFDSSGPSSGRG